jgi:molybdopterin synthase catalytic subunit
MDRRAVAVSPEPAAAAGPAPLVPVPLVHGPIDAAALLAAVADAAAGGNVLFVGTTRGVTAGVITVRLEYDAHAGMAAALLERLRREAVARFGLVACAVQHRLGPVAVGEASVAIAASAAHRREAFAAAEWLIDRIKREVPIWKCEEAADGGRAWVHPAEPPAVAATVPPGAAAGRGGDA